MAKGDWEVYDDDGRERTATDETPRTPCEEYGHSYDDVVTDVVTRVCNDCGDSYVVDDNAEGNTA
jgi:hypothetical protein